MKHLKTFENFNINEFFDFEDHFDIDEDVLSYVFDDLLNKYPFLGIELVEKDKSNFKVEIYDESPEPKDNLDDELSYLKSEKVMYQVKGHFDTMDFSIKSIEHDKKTNRIVLTIHQL